MIRVAVVDDDPALRAGVRTVLDAQPSIVYVGESDGAEEDVWPMLNHLRPDVVLLDCHLPGGDGLQLCYRIKLDVPAPKVIVFSAYASPALVPPARLARADAVLAKGAGERDLSAAIRLVAAGERLIPSISASVLEAAASPLSGNDRALVMMLLDGATEAEIGATLQIPTRHVRQSVQRILSALRLDVPAARVDG